MSAHQIVETVIGKEGRYSNNPDDAGGETMWGVTLRVARAYGYMGAMINLPRNLAHQILMDEYVVKPGFDKIIPYSEKIADEMIDTGVNMGVSHSGPWLQRGLNAFNQQGKLYPDIEVDGKIGPATLRSLRTYLTKRGAEGEKVMVKLLNSLQGARYLEITEKRQANETFVYGWFNNRVWE